MCRGTQTEACTTAEAAFGARMKHDLVPPGPGNKEVSSCLHRDGDHDSSAGTSSQPEAKSAPAILQTCESATPLFLSMSSAQPIPAAHGIAPVQPELESAAVNSASAGTSHKREEHSSSKQGGPKRKTRRGKADRKRKVSTSIPDTYNSWN
mmetsp:Transcript_53749/g.96281  ORF Transcript_53749/g.96281 Transcript_53749/m.96281 type:complete len:151 (+) Transcript_53749:3-455(+)